MAKGTRIDFKMLDVGCGTKPKGDVNIDSFRGGFNPQTGNQIQGEFRSPQKIKNFIISDAMHLPFKDESFEVVFSSHTIEHVQNPSAMLREMWRVAKRKVIIRYSHRRGSWAKKPSQVNYLDENWFKQTSNLLGFKIAQFATTYEGLFTSMLKKIFPHALQSTLLWKALRRFEISRLGEKFMVPLEMEVWARKSFYSADSVKVKFIVVYNIPEIFKRYFSSSPYASPDNVVAYHNTDKESIPKFFNKVIQEHLQENIWFVFCHQDFILQEDLSPRLKGKDTGTIYGPIGARPGENRFFFGMLLQTDGTPIGRQLKENTPVQTLDEMCLIVHSEVFRQGLLSFDERFRLHFYGADLCLQAYQSGFDVVAMQLKCQHKSRTFCGDLTAPEYLSARKIFGEKWKPFLPVKTTSAVFYDE
jgi:SAM-dependent methyltransferase